MAEFYVREYVKLICSMLVALEDYGVEIKFTKNDIDNIINKYNVIELGLKENKKYIIWNERTSILLWRYKYITDAQLAELLELEFENGEFWLICDDFESILSDSYETEAQILDGVGEWYPGEPYDTDVEWEWKKYYNQKTKKAIVDYCVDKGLEINGELMTTQNTIIKDEEVYFKEIKLVDIIDENKDLSELKSVLGHALCEAQETADQDYVYNKLKKNFENDIGVFKREMITLQSGKKEEKLLIRVDIDWQTIEKDLVREYGEYEFSDANYGNLFHILKENEYFEFKRVNLDYYSGNGDITEDTLNYYTQNRLSWD